MSDSDGDDAMAYFLPNGIADDSPPKRSALMASSSFGPIGAARFGGIYGSGAIATGSPNALDLSVPFGDPLASASGNGGAVASAATSRPNFLLSDLGGEILQSRDSDGTNNAIGGRRNPFAFSGAFASLSAAELDAQSRLASSSAGGSLYEPLNRGDVIGTQKGNSTASGFRNDAEISAPSSSSGLGSSGVYGRPTLNANAPAFMASSTQDAAPFGSSSPSAWPTMNVKPRRAPPGLSKPSKGTAASSLSGGHGRAGDGNPLSLPPGLPHPSHSAAFGGYPTSSSSVFSGDGVRHFASKLQPTFPLLSDTFRSNEPPSNQEFNSALSELNAKSLSVEEIQSNLKATALAAAHDVVEDAPIDQTPSRLSTPRKATKSPRRSLEFKSPSTADEKRGSEQSARGPTDPRLRTPTRRNEATLSAAVLGSPLPGIRSSIDRRGRTGKEQASSENVGRNPRSGPSDSSSKAGKRGRGAAQGVSAQIIGADARPANRSGQFEASSTAIPVSTSLKKQPSSISSAGSDDQLLSASSPAEIVEESREVQHKVKESQREPKSANRHASAKKSTTPVHSSEKRGGTRRQVYREKVVLPDTSKSIKTHGSDAALHGDSDADASGVDSQLDDTLEVDMKVAPPETKRPLSVVRDSASATSSTNAETPAVLLKDDISPENASASEAEVTANAKQPDALVSETIVDVESTSSAPVEGESMAVLNSPPATVLHKTPSTPIHFESDSGSEIPDVSARTVRAGGLNDRKTSAKESKKDKHKKERGDKKKSATPGKSTKKEKRDSSSSGKGDPVDDEPFNTIPAKKQTVPPLVKLSALLRDGRILVKRGVVALWSGWWFLCSEFADRINLRGLLGWSFSYLESFLAVVFSVILLLSLHGASFFIRLHRVAFRAVLTHRHVGFCFAFLYAFPFLVQYVFPWAPPWAPVCLWYAFLVQLFCTSGPAAMVATFRIVLPLMFLVEGISHHSFLLDLNGAELLLASFILSAMKTSNLCSPIFLLSLAVQCLSAVFLGSELVVQWFQMTLALYSLHAMAATDEDWAGLGDEEEELSCRPLSMHHSIADYNYHPAPSAPSVQKSKRLDRRALAYVRGRKAR